MAASGWWARSAWPTACSFEFADGTHAAGDLLIGADGLYSQTRRLIDPDAPSPRYTGQLSLGGRARVATLDATPGTFHMIFGRKAFFGFSVPTAGDVYWFANIGWPGEPSTAYLSAIPLETWRKMLRELFQDDEGPAVEIIDRGSCELAAYPVYDIRRRRRARGEGAARLRSLAETTRPGVTGSSRRSNQPSPRLRRSAKALATADGLGHRQALQRTRVEFRRSNSATPRLRPFVGALNRRDSTVIPVE